MANALIETFARAIAPRQKTLSPPDSRGGWWPIVKESFSGAWQHNFQLRIEDSLQYWAVFRCVSIIASDIGKMRLRLMQRGTDDIWSETTRGAFSPVISKPNRMQTRIQFFQHWMESKLSRGNTYVLKQRDNRGVVIALYVLDPCRTRPMIADNGDVFYELRRDNISGVQTDVVLVPASEIIHDRWNTFYHPLVGLSPIYACGINACTALRIETNSARLFQNGARPSGMLTAPGAIGDATAARLKAYWDDNFTGENVGKVAVLGDGLAYTAMTMNAVDAQLIDQLRWNDVAIAGAYGVPSYMINAGAMPLNNNVEALSQQYYSQCLQIHIEAIELCLDEGLGLAGDGTQQLGVEFDLDDLLRMDEATKVKTAVEGLKGIFAPNEARRKFNLSAVPGGDAVYLQQQNFSLEALNKRDQKDDPFASSGSASGSAASAATDPNNAAADPVATQLSIRSLATDIRRRAYHARPAA